MTSVAPPTATVGPSAEVARARIAVMVSHYQVDIVVPTKFTIETFIDDLLVVLIDAIDDESVDFNPPAGQWSLARPGELPIPRWRSLGEVDIDDGTVLMLVPVESAEVFTPIVEDITDALALINDREFAEFDANTSAVVGLGALVLGASAFAAMLGWSWTQTGAVGWTAIPAMVLGMVCWLGALVAREKYGSPRACLGFSLAALPLVFAGGAMLVPPPYGEPGPFTAANYAAGAVVAAVASATMLRLTKFGIATLTSVTGVGLIVTAAAIPATYLNLGVKQVAAGVLLVALILLAIAPRMAVAIARIRPPDLPDPGDDVAPSTLTDIFDAETIPADAEIEDDENQDVGIESRARLAVTSLRGLIVALSVVLAASAVLAASDAPGGVREIIQGTCVAGILVLRARWYPDRVQALALVSGAAVIVVGIGWVLVHHYDTSVARLCVAVIVLLAAMLACLAAVLLPGVRLSPVTRRFIDLFEYLLIVIVPVIAFWIMGVYTAMRQL